MRSHVGALVLTAAFAVLAGCAHSMSEIHAGPGTSLAPGVVWTPPPGTPMPAAVEAPRAPIPPELLEAAQHWTLPQLVDLALRKSPQTRSAWAAARSAAAAYGSERGAYYPNLELDANVTRLRGSAAGGTIRFQQTSYGPTLIVNYLLLDLGGRAASVEEARQALIAADWSHNAAIQDVVLAVEQAYYQFAEAKALREASLADVNEARTNLDAADQRHAAGVATIADVLQAKTALAESQLSLDTVEGQIQTVKGALATAVGIPANTPFDVDVPVGDLPLDKVTKDVEELIRDAEARRPDLAAARSRAAAARSHVDKVRSDGRLSLGLSGQLAPIWYEGGGHQDTYTTALLLRVPLFSGYSQRYNTLQAQADADRSEADLESLGQQVVYRVWASYYNLMTAAQRVKTILTLVESASESNEVALGRYKAGVGSILDLLVAQGGLSSARAQQVVARADWFLSLAQLARETGTLWPPPEAPQVVTPSALGTTKGKP